MNSSRHRAGPRRITQQPSISSDNSDSDPEPAISNPVQSLSTPLTSHTPATHLPSTPTSNVLTSSIAFSRKRSLTLLSPENISTRSGREIKKVAFIEQTELGDSGSSTELDTDTGFQFLTDVD